jgi:hypothetical protein
LFNELTHSSSAPQAETHLELLWSLVDDHALDGGVFLCHTEHPAITSGKPTLRWSDGAPATPLKQINGCSHRRVTQPSHRDDLHDFDAFCVQPNDLLAPLVKLL